MNLYRAFNFNIPRVVMRKIAFVVNRHKRQANQLLKKLITYTKKLGIETKHTTEYPIPKNFLKGFDACCVIGGDGTLLGTVEEATKHQVPIFGFNQGKLGFLITLHPSKATDFLAKIIKGHYKIGNRTILCCFTDHSSYVYALNDIVIKNLTQTRLMEFEVYCDQEFVTDYRSDGVIFCTPTGSTAYNLSAGGPIISPKTKVFGMTPICPHTLTNRTVVFDPKNEITVSVKQPNDVVVAIDGTIRCSDHFNFPLKITVAKQTFPLLQPEDYSHFETLRNKLGW